MKVFEGISKEVLDKRIKLSQPDFIAPMLATLTNKYFSSDSWFYEHKFDGERCLAFKKNGKVKLISRNNKSMNIEYPELVSALEGQIADNFIIDGEITAKASKNQSSFQLLQSRMHIKDEFEVKSKEKSIKIFYNIFDLIYLSNYDIRQLPLYARKQILKNFLFYNNILVYTDHKVRNGIEYFHEACKLGWEGLIAKKSDSLYQTGIRSQNWLKFKCIMEQELVIGGYTNPKGSRSYFGALLVGYYDHNKLIYAGKVGTGYTEQILKFLGKKLEKIRVQNSPFDNYTESKKDVNWVKPILVGEFKFAEWTNSGKLRVGRYKGLRDDKSALDVIKEIPK